MPGFFDFLSNTAQGANNALGGLPATLLNQPAVKPILGLGLLGLLAQPIVNAVNRKRDEPGARAGLWRTFGQLGLNELYRPRQMQDELMKLGLAKDELTQVAPTPGAQPAGYYGQTPMFRRETLGQAHPSIFNPPALTGTGFRTQASNYGGGAPLAAPPMTPMSALQPPVVSPSLQLLSNLPNNQQSLMGLATILGRPARGKTQAELMQEVLSPEELRQSYLQKGQGAPSMAGLAQQYFGGNPAKMEEFLLKGRGATSNRPYTIRDQGNVFTFVNDAQGNPQIVGTTPIQQGLDEWSKFEVGNLYKDLADLQQQENEEGTFASPTDRAARQRRIQDIQNKIGAIRRASEPQMGGGPAQPATPDSLIQRYLTTP